MKSKCLAVKDKDCNQDHSVNLGEEVVMSPYCSIWTWLARS